MSRCTHLSRWPIAIIILLIATIIPAIKRPPEVVSSTTTNAVSFEAASNKKLAPLKTSTCNVPRAVIAVKIVELVSEHSPPVASCLALTAITNKDSALRLFAAPPCSYILFCLSWIAYLSAIG